MSTLAGERKPRIYLFYKLEHVENALSNWLGEVLPDEPISLLRVSLPADAKTKNIKFYVDVEVEYELCVYTTIPPEYIKIITKNIDTYFK